MERSMDTPKGTLYYTQKEQRIAITAYHGMDAALTVPEYLDDLPVCSIEKKAFMNSRLLQRVTLPDTIKKLGEWAFAYCALLEEISLPRCPIAVGTGVFLENSRLARIVLRAQHDSQTPETLFWTRQSQQYREQIAVLLAAVPAMEGGEYLLDFFEAGEASWLEKWDVCLRRLLADPDEEGYTKLVLCGEEDVSCSLDHYIQDRRREKVRYCFLRLLHSAGLSDDMRKQLEEYLLSHSVGCASEESWLVMKEELGHLQEYYEMYVRLGCLNEQNYDATLTDLGEAYPEMKAYFMRTHAQTTSEDFFSRFAL